MPRTPGVKHIVSHFEGIGERGLVVGHAEQILVGDDDQCVDLVLQFLYALFGHAHAFPTLEVEGHCHETDGEHAHLAGYACHDRGRSGARASAHAGGDEDHVRAAELLGDLVHRLLGRSLADVRSGACAEALRDRGPELDPAVGARLLECLGIRVGDDELDAGKPVHDHVVDRVSSPPTDADDRDARLDGVCFGDTKLNNHLYLLRIRMP